MKILLISTAFSGLTQRFYTELTDAGYAVSVELHLGNDAQLLEGVQLFQPNLILCPFLTRRLSATIYQHYPCLIVHPGIKGDRGPSSLDWAIQQGEAEWGVTLMEAAEEMDSGAIWASKTFPLRAAGKSSVFNREVTQTAVECLWEALTYFDAAGFQAEPLDYSKPGIKGQLRAQMKQGDRKIDWKTAKTTDILRRIRAADGSPGVLDDIFGQPFYLFNAHPETVLRGKAGDIIAATDQAICRATVDGAVWIGHLKPKLADHNDIKLPAVQALKDCWPKPKPGLQAWRDKPIKTIAIDYHAPGRQLPCQEVWYELKGEAAYLYFAFHNGAMSTGQCRLLLSVYQHVATLPVKAIVLMGGEDIWSNGIHLNQIEAAQDPAEESWQNINAMNDLIAQIINTLDKVTVAAVCGNAGAGGAILAIAPDKVLAREGVVFNPHYKNMGELYGSEYWTYLLPKRVGQAPATDITEQRLPISARKAWHMGLVDKVLDKQHSIFNAQVKHLVDSYIGNPLELAKLLNDKANTRRIDEIIKPLAAYRKFELTQMYANFFTDTAYHTARQCFVHKKPRTETPANLAKHRLNVAIKPASAGGMAHFVWKDSYALGDEKIDREHRDFFELAEKLLSATHKTTLLETLSDLQRHVQEHFAAEERLMHGTGFHLLKSHCQEHALMREQLEAMTGRIADDHWQAADLQTFIGHWAHHIQHADMAFNSHWKEMNVYCL
ncbi:enoyl-CoA hydratase-related protein [Methylomonas sp. SURF-2]|uniref:Enoyl-CoA hydratase-related protein n=1 Tax=Methylomonas subterranea TaxID=2952225 RepID=A0ABT1TF41_9GAMM|nr:hemerythrin domain-containing protein [Methylomonas sp. SURF-2]MCQ8103878.1 enoyl-CoA hydratase-related protein [Methylomonas sp. SURF-2]